MKKYQKGYGNYNTAAYIDKMIYNTHTQLQSQEVPFHRNVFDKLTKCKLHAKYYLDLACEMLYQIS